jgi:uncharacterized glyoxalase superfamily protein PhnB
VRPVVVTQVNVVGRDMAAAVSFYRRLGWTIETPMPEHSRTVLPNGLRIEFDTREFAGIWDSGFCGRTGGSTLLGVETTTRDEVDKLFGDLLAHGGRGRQSPYDAFWGSRFAIVEDPDGNPVGLLSPVTAARRFWPPSGPPQVSG